MKKKGIYPYDYMDSFDKFKVEQLPKKEDFYNALNKENITDEEYEHAQKVWKPFRIKNMGDYHDVYLMSDVILLGDVFENFRKTCLEYYGLDPCHYYTSPGLAWDAMLKMTKIKLDLIDDIDKYQFIEKGMKGGISYIANRYAKANNKYMENYNTKEDRHRMYLDPNNLYGWAVSQPLPTGNFRWKKHPEKTDLSKYTEDSEKGIILEDDLKYSKKLHNLHNDYPLAPEKRVVNKEKLSSYFEEIKNQYNVSVGKVSKLVTTLEDKRHYVIHYKSLQLYTSLGLKIKKIKKIHRVLEFKQSKWLKQYIDFNTTKRTNPKNAFEKDFFKLMNNSVFGKTMENLRKRVDVKLITDKKKLIKYTSKPTFISRKIFNENLVAVHKMKEVLTLNRPAYVGMCILELSKTLMYDFHYNAIKKLYNDKAKLLFTDTDSRMYEIKTKDVYKDLYGKPEMRNLFDNSDYSEDSKYFFKENKKVTGKMKDEAAGVPITEFV